MDKLKLHTPDLTAENIEKIAALFPNCVAEAKDSQGQVKRAIDFDLLRQELSKHIIEGPHERYHLDWPGKREALLAANAPIAKTLRPFREESVDYDKTKNLFIEGDNLDALKLLQETYLGRIKIIYIDPPYNTGQDFIYSDKFNTSAAEYFDQSLQKDDEGSRLVGNLESSGRFHSTWLSMMYSRLKLARNLLHDDGIIFISIDEGEVANLRKLADLVFGELNFVEQIAWKNKYGSGALTKGFANVHEYILVYSKKGIENIAAPLSEEQREQYKLRDEKFEKRGGYVTQPFATNSKDDRPNLRYPILHNGNKIMPEKQWIWSEDRFLAAYKNNEVVINETDGKFSVRIKQYLRDENGVERLGKPISFLTGPFNQEGTKDIHRLFGKPVFDFPKPVSLLKYLFSFRVNDTDAREDVILDFFGGSCAAAEAVMQLNASDGGNRRFIMVQLPAPCAPESVAHREGYKTIAEIGKERIRRAGKQIVSQLSDTQRPADKGQPALSLELAPPAAQRGSLDAGFRVLKVDTSNMKDVYYAPDSVNQEDLNLHTDNIKEDRTPEDLLFQVLVDWGVDLGLPIEKQKISDHTVYFVDGNALAACFDSGVTEDLVKELAKRKPLRAVFRDSSFAGDSVKINVEQIFKLLSPETEVKSL